MLGWVEVEVELGFVHQSFLNSPKEKTIVNTLTQPFQTSPKFEVYTKMTLHHHPHTHHKNSISAISQLLLGWFWPKFKRRFLGPSLTDANCHGDICPCSICPGNICPGDICPYQIYISLYWPDFPQTQPFQPRSFDKPKLQLCRVAKLPLILLNPPAPPSPSTPTHPLTHPGNFISQLSLTK